MQINDAFVWSGSPSGPGEALRRLVDGGAGPARLEEVRRAIEHEDYRAAEALLKTFQGPYSQEYLPFVDLMMDLACASGGERVDYRGRELDLDRAIVTERFRVGAATVVRETWASHPAGVICVRIESDAPLEIALRLSTELRGSGVVAHEHGIALGVVIPSDGAPLHEAVDEPLRYDEPGWFDNFGAAALHVVADRAVRTEGDLVLVSSATSVLVTIASSTTASKWWARSGEALDRNQRSTRLSEARATAAEAASRGADALLDEHLRDIESVLGATAVRIGRGSAGSLEGVLDVADDVLGGGDDALTATVLLQFGRYLLASASRSGGPPANLQGIWNDQLQPAWSSNYTININTQMNYWGAEAAGLGECHLPLFDLLDRLADNGRAVARELYGAHGWVAHHNADLWGWALPVGAGHGDPAWANWAMGGTWLSQHVWQHYEFSLDSAFLRERWPLLRGAAEFALSWLIDDGGTLRTSPSTSPENLFVGPDGHPESLGESASMDVSLIAEVLRNTLDAAAVLGIDDALCAEARAVLHRLPAPAITAGGWLQEWGDDRVEVDPQHRHLSQMVALYPLRHITPSVTPELAVAARRVLERRGGGAMGWSWAWKMALRARLGDGDSVRELLLEASRPFTRDHRVLAQADGSEWGGLLPNLFSTHPPFQIDGNFGFVAAILEMLVSSERGAIRLLPALPGAWPVGEARGVRAAGGIEVDLSWSDGRLVTAKLASRGPVAEVVVVRLGDGEVTLRLEPGRPIELDPGSFEAARPTAGAHS